MRYSGSANTCKTLPAVPDQPKTLDVWNVRETLLDALELNAAITASKQDRGAPAREIAQARFNDYGPLIQLGRIDDALTLLLDCRQAFEKAHDILGLGQVLSALADVEDRRGHGTVAISLEHDALRYMYLAGDVIGIGVGHHNLGYYLRRHARQPAGGLAHHLAAAVVRALARADGVDRCLRAARDELRALGANADPPADIAGLCRLGAGVPGTDLERLSPLAAALGRILGGERDPGLAEGLDDPVHRAVVDQVRELVVHDLGGGDRAVTRCASWSCMTSAGATGRYRTPSSISAHSSGAGGSSRVRMACRPSRASTRLSTSPSAVFGRVASTARA